MFQTNYDSEQKLWSNCDMKPIYNSNISTGQLILEALSAHGSHIAQISDDSGVSVIYQDIYIKTVRAAQNLQNRGYGPRQVFGFMTKNLDDVAPLVFASFCLNCPINPIHPSSGRKEIMDVFEVTRPVVIFCETEYSYVLKDVLNELRITAKIFTLNAQTDDLESIANLFLEVTDIDYMFTPFEVDAVNDAVAIVCSSGTTGKPKNIFLSHDMYIESLTSIGIVNIHDVLFSFELLYGIDSIWTLSLSVLHGSTRIITSKRFSPELQFELIEKYKINTLLSNPHHLVSMLKSDRIHIADLSSLRKLFLTGSKPPAGLRAKINEYLPNTYMSGLYSVTEAGGLVAVEYPICTDVDTSVGKLRRGCTVKIINEYEKRCGIGIKGEIRIKLDKKITDKELTDAEGFFSTKDIGYFDADGYLHILDRNEDIINFRFRSFSPSAIETFLLMSPSIALVCVVGIPHKKSIELPTAVIVRSPDSLIAPQHIYDMVANNFQDFMKLRGGVYFIEQMPMTPSGKIIRDKVKDIALNFYESTNRQFSFYRENVFDFCDFIHF